MFKVKVDWQEFKSKADTYSLTIYYGVTGGNYVLHATSTNVEWTCVLPTSDASDFETNYQSNAVALN